MTVQSTQSVWERLAARLRLIWTLATTDGVVKRSLLVAAVVGTILTLINQGDRIFTGHQPLWWKVGLTYCVPFCVATYGAVTARLATLPKPEQDPPAATGAVAVVVDAGAGAAV